VWNEKGLCFSARAVNTEKVVRTTNSLEREGFSLANKCVLRRLLAKTGARFLLDGRARRKVKRHTEARRRVHSQRVKMLG
jgi:hypothetical protein